VQPAHCSRNQPKPPPIELRRATPGDANIEGSGGHFYTYLTGRLHIFPNLEEKRDICENAIDLARVLGFKEAKVAILSAVETVTEKIPSTLVAAALCKMADRGQITGALVDGPLAFDNAVNEAATQTKHIVSPVAGKANILLVPDLEAGNMLAKQLTYMADADAAGIVLGARIPIMLTSRADTPRTRIASAAVAVLLAHARRQTIAAGE
jgi:phosphotransacetylase